MKWTEILSFFNRKAQSLTVKARIAKDKKNMIMLRAKAGAYKKVYRTIRDNFTPNEAITVSKINYLGISQHMKDKIKYYLDNPDKLPKITIKEKVKTQKKMTKKLSDSLIQELTGFMGIGTATAKLLVKKGLTNINQIRNKKYIDLLSDQTKMFLSLRPIKRIPHKDIEKLEPIITQLHKGTEMIIVGSYRRQTRFSRDVDVMVVSNDNKILFKIIKKLYSKLGKDNVYPYTIGPDKISVLIRAPTTSKTQRKKFYKIDYFRTPLENKWAMLLYSTGSQSHNIFMRNRAKRRGMLLNQCGLYDRESKKLLSSKAKLEKFFFDKLELKYKEPHERV